MLTPLSEGIGLVVPITDAMKEPRKFPKVLSGVMIFLMCEWQFRAIPLSQSNPDAFGIAVLFGGAGALAYLTFGDQIQTVVIVNFDSRSKMVQAVSHAEDCVLVCGLNHVIGAIPVLRGHFTIHPSATFPGR